MDDDEKRLLAELQKQNAELQQQVAALELSHQLLRAVVDGSSDAMFVKDLRGRYLFANTATTKFAGKSVENILGHDDTLLFSAETARQIMMHDRRIMEAGETLTVEEVGTAAGQTRTYLSTKQPFRNDQGHVIGVIGVSRDITERKRTEDALRESNERFQLVAKATNDAVWDWNLKSDIGWWNDGVYPLFGYQREQTPAESILWNEHLHPEDRDRVLRGIQAVIDSGGQSWSDEYRIVRADGTVAVVFDRGFVLRDSNGQAYRMIGAAMDITDHRRAEQAVRDNEARVMGLINSAMDAIITIDEQQKIVLFNPAAETIFQCSRAEALGQPIHQFLPERYRDAHLQQVRNFVNSGSSMRQMGQRSQVVGLRRGGSEFPAEASILKVQVGDQQFFTVILRDISERHRTEVALRESEGRLRLLVQASNVGLWDWNLLNDEVYFSPEWKRQLGYSADELSNRYEEWKSRLHPEDRAHALAAVSDFRTGRISEYDIEFRLRHKDGSWRWILARADLMRDAAGQPVRMMGCHVDVTERKQAEEMLRKSESKFATVFHNTPLAVGLTTLAEGRILDVNDSYCSLLGYSKEELIGHTTSELNLIADLGDRAKHVELLKKHGRILNVETRYRNRSGETREVLICAELLEMNGESVILGISQDITERKQVEASLAAERQLLRTMADNLPAYVFVKDTEGRYLFVNLIHVRQLGLNFEADMLGKTVFDIYPADIARAFDLDDKTVIQTGQPVIEREEPFTSKEHSGWFLTTKVPLRDAQGKVTGLLGIALDITARKQAEAALVEERNLLRTLVDHIPDFIFVKDLQSRQLLNNAANVRLIGAQSDAELVGTTVFDHYPRELAQRYYDEDQRVMQTGQAQLNQEESVLDKAGRQHWLLSSKVPLRDVDGKCIGLVGIKRDITEHRRVNAELAASRTRLEVLSRQLIATQEFERRHLARELHDEIGQALTGIKLNLKALQTSANPSKSATLVSDTIAVVDQTLQQVRSLALELRPSILDDIGLVAALRWCLDRQTRQAGFSATFMAEPSEGPISPDVAIACFRIAQESLTNIARHARARNVRVELQQRETELELLVRDDGCGFDVHAARDRAARGGSLGLLGMEERSQLVGGAFEIISAPFVGTMIRARFPLQDASKTSEEPA